MVIGPGVWDIIEMKEKASGTHIVVVVPSCQLPGMSPASRLNVTVTVNQFEDPQPDHISTSHATVLVGD